MNKRFLKLGLVVVLAISMFAGCASNNAANEANVANTTTETEATETETTTETETETTGYADGSYFIIQDEFDEETGWKYALTLEVEEGVITSVDWDGVSIQAGMSKKELSEAGLYNMVEYGNAIAPWFEQAVLAEEYLLETQDPTAIEYQADNYHTDAITGVTIGVSPMFKLAEQALANGPQEPGPYKDGAYYAEEADFSEKSGFKGTIDITVMFGNIESVNWNAIHKDGGDDKKTLSMNGEYGMVENGAAQAPWIDQARLTEAFLLESQDATAIEYQSDNYHTDAITGVTIGVSPMFKLAEEALKDAK